MNTWQEQYQWLLDALKPECDKVMTEEFDFGTAYAAACQWGDGANKKRIGVKLEYTYNVGGTWVEGEADPEDDYTTGHWEGGVWEQYSVNGKIAAGELSREAVVAHLLKARPAEWSRS